MSTEIVALSRPEGDRLAQCEATIRRGLHTFVEVGQALAEIRDSRLYRATHETFAAYLDDRWQISRTRAHELISGAAAVKALPESLFAIANTESKARELARVPEEERVQVLEQAAARASEAGRKLTADDIRQAYMPTRPTRPVVRPKLQHPAHWPDISTGVDAYTESCLSTAFHSLDSIRPASRAKAYGLVEQYLQQARNKTSS